MKLIIMSLIFITHLKADFIHKIENARLISMSETEAKIISGKSVHIIDVTSFKVPSDLCNRTIRVPSKAIKSSAKASKRQISFTCKPTTRQNQEKAAPPS